MDFRSERRKTSGNLGRTGRRECLRFGPPRRLCSPRNEPSSFDIGLTHPDESRLRQSEHQGSKSKCQAPPRCLLVDAHRKTPAQTHTRLGPRAARQFLHRHDRTLRIVFLPPWHAFHGLVPGIGRLYWCLPAFALRSPDARAAAGRLRGGFADFAETHFLPLLAGQRAPQRPRAGMHADRGVVSFHRVLELIAGFDLQRLANLPWNCCLSLPGDRGMGHESLLTSYLFLTSLLCLTWPLVGKESREVSPTLKVSNHHGQTIDITRTSENVPSVPDFSIQPLPSAPPHRRARIPQ